MKSDQKKVFIVTGGGTGGHLSVARSFIEELSKRDHQVIFVGSLQGQDQQWFENASLLKEKYFLKTRGVVNQNFFGKIHSAWMIGRAVIQAIGIIRKHKVSKVISVGGFSAAPASFAAFFTKTDFYIHEQNSIAGRLNAITAKFAKEVFSSYLEDSKVKDYPIAKKFFQAARIRKNIQTIIFLGGSQGATAINNFAVQIAPQLQKMNIRIIHQTGKRDFEKIDAAYKSLGIHADVFDFSENLLEKMEQSDFAVSRSGASTLWELVALGIPTFFIPYPFAAANHQYFNARYLVQNNLCFLQEEKDLDQNYFFQCLQEDIASKSEQLLQSIHQDAIQNIIDIIE